ncbi:MAG: conjugal transfer protein TraG N-terminal domain-containing protein [Gammaproteobacteria bacterium]|nr:conjugal transfer protein TraG N-terminal domain-containing protein [Gammaproteobacteria bacterium]
MLQVYVFTAGATTREVFNAIAAFMNTDDFSKAISIGVMCSVIGALVQMMQTHDYRILFKWFAICLMVLLCPPPLSPLLKQD